MAPATVYSSKGSMKLKSGINLTWLISQLPDKWYRVNVMISEGNEGKCISHVYRTKNECLMWVDEIIYCHNLSLPIVTP